MKKSEQVNEIAAALAKAQGAIANPSKNKTVKVTTKSGSDYQFSYADLDAIIMAVKKPLTDNGLSYTQTLEQDPDGKFRLETTLWHSSGQFMVSETPLFVDRAESQSFGSALTFMKRYALAALLGVAADSDDDANAADGNKAEISDRKPKKPAENVIATKFSTNGIGSEPVKFLIPLTPDNEGPDWMTFGRMMASAIQNSRTHDDTVQWVELNSDSLRDMEKAAPKPRERLSAIITEKYTTFRSGDSDAKTVR